MKKKKSNNGFAANNFIFDFHRTKIIYWWNEEILQFYEKNECV